MIDYLKDNWVTFYGLGMFGLGQIIQAILDGLKRR